MTTTAELPLVHDQSAEYRLREAYATTSLHRARIPFQQAMATRNVAICLRNLATARARRAAQRRS